MGNTLRYLARDVGIPNKLLSDGAKEMGGPKTEFQKQVRFLHIDHTTNAPYHEYQNKGERVICELRRRSRDVRRKKKMKRCLWDFVLMHQAEVMSRTWNRQTGRTGVESITGDTPDISEWIDFEMYDKVWYWDSPHQEDNPLPGRWLGVSHQVGSALCYFVLNKSGNVLSRTTVQHVTDDELKKDEVRQTFDELDGSINKELDDTKYLMKNPSDIGILFEEDLDDTDEGIDNPEPVKPELRAGDVDTQTNEESSYDQYIGAELILEAGPEGSPRRGTVVKRARNIDGELIGRGHGNPILDTRRYIVDVEGQQHEYAANQIAENLYSQVDTEGRSRLIMKAIIDHKKDGNAIEKADGYFETRSGQKRKKITTRGWKLKVEWADGTASWMPLSEMKDANPIETAEYAVTAKIADEPAFAWWVPVMLRRRNAIIGKVKGKYWRTTHKFGIRLPHSVEEAYRIDEINKNDYWRRAIEKEMARIRVALEQWDGGNTPEEAEKKLIDWQFVKTHMVFDIRIDGLVRKARLVADGHMTEAPSATTYSSVVSRDSVRIAFLVAALNGLEVKAANIGNAYLNAPCREKVWTVAGPEFGEDEGKVFLITRALYGLPGSGSAWRSFFANVLVHDLKFKRTRGDPDVYIRKAVKSNGFEYCEMLLTYVDDILVVSHDTKPIMDRLSGQFRLKEDSLGAPTWYLGAKIKIFTDKEGQDCYAISSDEYVANAVKGVEEHLAKQGLRLRGKAN